VRDAGVVVVVNFLVQLDSSDLDVAVDDRPQRIPVPEVPQPVPPFVGEAGVPRVRLPLVSADAGRETMFKEFQVAHQRHHC
jgi:hypothetical protein